MRYVDCDVRQGTGGGADILMIATEIKGGLFQFIGGSIYSNKNAGATGYGMFDWGAGGDVSKATERSYVEVKTRIEAPLETLAFYFNATANWCPSWDIDVTVNMPSLNNWFVRNTRPNGAAEHPEVDPPAETVWRLG